MKRTREQIETAHKELRSVWPQNCHSTSVDNFVFKPGWKACDCCELVAVQRIIVNIWGTVCEVDACIVHARMDRFWMDSIPTKQTPNYQEAV